jgi:hypothetical protein
MFGIGFQELLIAFVIFGMIAVPAAVVVAVLIRTQRSQQDAVLRNPNLVTCPDCGGTVSKSALNCPHCGRPRP